MRKFPWCLRFRSCRLSSVYPAISMLRRWLWRSHWSRHCWRQKPYWRILVRILRPARVWMWFAAFPNLHCPNRNVGSRQILRRLLPFCRNRCPWHIPCWWEVLCQDWWFAILWATGSIPAVLRCLHKSRRGNPVYTPLRPLRKRDWPNKWMWYPVVRM